MNEALLIAQLVNDVILAATLVAVIVYTVKTADMADATKTMADSAKQSSDSALKTLDEMHGICPVVVCGFGVIAIKERLLATGHSPRRCLYRRCRSCSQFDE